MQHWWTMRRMLAGCAAALVITACGGGGGGSTSADAPGPTPPVAADPDAPTLIIEPRRSLGMSASTLVPLSLAASAHMLNLAQLAVDVAHRLAPPASAMAVDVPCPISGRFALTLIDRDADAHLGTGDAITVRLDRCRLPLLRGVAHGLVRVEVLAAEWHESEDSLTLQLEFGDGLRLQGHMFEQGDPFDSHTMVTGSLRVQWRSDGITTRLSVVSTDADDLRMESTPYSWLRLVTATGIAIHKTVRFDQALVEYDLGYVLGLGGRGRAKVSTPQTWQARLNQRAHAGRAEILGAQGVRLAIAPFPGEHRDIDSRLLAADGREVEAERIHGDGSHDALGWDTRAGLVIA
ncbi:MAG: hypothetical protein KF683_25265, partial [Rubrivivax sp.]|nr:hypothetical protein [Rubrivivax sp.]